MAQGSITAHVYTSSAEIPLYKAAVSITKRSTGGKPELLAFRLTNRDGLTEPVFLETPPAAASQSSGQAERPFSVVDMAAEQAGYDRVLTESVQVFPKTATRQDFQLVPTAELPDFYDLTDVFPITAQNL